MHPFFTKIKEYPVLEKSCRMDITDLPQAYTGKNKTKAILLGADPTNDGIRNKRGLIKLDTVFGINSKYENYFFAPHLINLNAIGLDKNNLYIQNVCRNYFHNQTTENRYWFEFAELWKPYLINELNKINSSIPILATSNEVFTFLTGIKGPFTKIYSMEMHLEFIAKDFNRKVFPLFRGRAYIFHKEKWMNYRNYLKDYFEQ